MSDVAQDILGEAGTMTDDAIRPDSSDWQTESLTRFRVVPDRSAVLVKARSNVGSIAFGTSRLSGELRFHSFDGSLTGLQDASAHIEVQVAALASGNALYDAEMHRRIDGRRFPTIGVELASAVADRGHQPVPAGWKAGAA